MLFYYTGATKYLGEQIKPQYSLGGYVSNSIIPNGQLANLFSEISQLTYEKNSFEVKAIVLKNTLGVAANNIYFWFENEVGNYGDFELAVVTLNQDSDFGFYMEQIQNCRSLPYYATFYTANGEANKRLLGNLGANEYLGIWLKRTLNLPNMADANSCVALKANFDAETTLSKIETLKIQLNWTSV